MDKSLTRWKRPIFKIRSSRNSQISVWKPYFFSAQAIPKILSVLYSSYTGDTPYRVWFNLDKSLTRWKRPIFKIRYSRNSQISVWKPNFFPTQAIPKILSVLYSSYTGDTPYRVWFNLDKSLTRWKRPIFKIRYSRNSQISVWKPNFFPTQAVPKILSVLYSSYTGDTPYRVWFNLDNSLTQWKSPIYKIYTEWFDQLALVICCSPILWTRPKRTQKIDGTPSTSPTWGAQNPSGGETD